MRPADPEPMDPARQYTDGSYLERVPDWHEEDSAFKAEQVADIIRRNNLTPRSVIDIGCGTGGIIAELRTKWPPPTRFVGCDLSPQAIERAQKHADDRCVFHVADARTAPADPFDLLLAIDVFEHIPDFMGFLNQLRARADWLAFHIPLDMFALGVFLDHPAKTRALHGHLHYFSKSTALKSLEDAGYEIVDWRYTKWGWQRPVRGGHRLLKLPRRILFALAPDAAVRLLGGCSLMVLARNRSA